MRFLKCLAVLAVICVFASKTVARGMFLKKGENAITLSGGFFDSEDFSGVGVGFCYCLDGFIDISLALSKGKTKEKEVAQRLDYTAFSPSIALHIVKDTNEQPISLAITGAYEIDSFSSDVLDALHWDMTGSGQSLGVVAYFSVLSSGGLFIVPLFGIAHNWVKIKLEDEYGQSVDTKDESNTFLLAVGFKFTSGQQHNVIAIPEISVSEGMTVFGLSVGLMFDVP